MSSVPSRRPHHKSKLGCSTCKSRRIKCDETRPSCRNCAKRGVHCSFPIFDPKFRFSSASLVQDGKTVSRMHVFPQIYESPSPSLSPPSLLDVLAQNGCLDNSLDILRPRFQQILHHFMNSTNATIAPPESQTVWTRVIPQIAGTHIFVLQGVFAVASLHLSRVGTEKESEVFHRIAAGQLSTGLSRYRNAIQNITEENFEALFVFSSVTTSFMMITASENSRTLIQSLQTPNLTWSRRQKTTSELATTMAGIIRSMRGVLIFLVPYWSRFMEGHLSPLLRRDWWPSPFPTTSEAIKENRILHELERIWMRPGRKYEYYFDVLRNTLKSLRECFALVSQLKVHAETTGTAFDWSSVMTWPIHCCIEFIKLLEGQQPDAWIIMAHYAILPSRLETVWWLESFAPNIIAAAAVILGEAKWSLIEWPASVVGVDLENFRLHSQLQPQIGNDVIPLKSPWDPVAHKGIVLGEI